MTAEEPIRRTGRRAFRVTASLAVGALLVAGGTGISYGLSADAGAASTSTAAVATGTDPTADPTGTAGTGTTPDTTAPTDSSGTGDVPPAPPDLPDTLKTVYASVYHAAKRVAVDGTVAQDAQPMSLDDFNAQINALTPDQLAVIYQAVSNTPGWFQLPQTYDNVTAPAAPSDSGTATSSDTAGTSTGTTDGQGAPAATTTVSPRRAASLALQAGAVTAVQAAAAVVFGPAVFPDAEPEPTGELAEPPLPFNPTSVHDAGANNCADSPTGILEGKLAVAIASSVAQGAALAVPDGEDAAGFTFPSVARIVLEAITIAAEAVEASLDYAIALADACDAEYQDSRLENIDKNLVKNFALATQNENTLAQVNKAVNLVHDQAHVLIKAQLAQLKLDLQQALSLPAGQIPNIAYELPASAGGYLDTTPVGVKALVSQALANAQAAGVPTNPASSRYLAQADQELADQHYKQAYVDYQRAYSEMAQ